MAVIPPENVCTAAERIATFVAVRGDDISLVPLFETVGLDESTLVHMAEHLMLLGINVDGATLTMVALLTLLAVDHDGTDIHFSDKDYEELLRPTT